VQQTPYNLHDKLHDYVLGELDAGQAAEVEAHLAASPEARDEVERLRLTLTALEGLPAEEPPRRIAFVSDKIFEPTGWDRFRGWLTGGAPGMAFGAAACLAVLFGGIALTEPRLASTAEGWELAFGSAPAIDAPGVESPAPQPVGLDEAAVAAIVAEAVAAERERSDEALAALVAGQSKETVAEFRRVLAEHESDAEMGFLLVQKRLDEWEKGFFQTAEVR